MGIFKFLKKLLVGATGVTLSAAGLTTMASCQSSNFANNENNDPDSSNPETETPDTESPDEIDPSEETPDGQNKSKYCKIKFDLPSDAPVGASLTGSTTTSVRNGKYFSTVKKPTVNCPEGYKCTGWSETSTGTEKTLITDNTKVTKDYTLYAVFEKTEQTYKIPVFAGKFSFYNKTEKIITFSTNKTEGTITELMGSTTLAENNDYVLKYWSDGTNTYSATDEINFTTVKALYAVETPKIRSVKVEDKTGETHEIWDTFQLTGTIDSISELDSPTIKWASSNESVATVDDTGKVNCVGKGSTAITLEVSTPWQNAITSSISIELSVSLKQCCHVIFTEDGSIKLSNYDDNNPDLQYSTDEGSSWNDITTTATSFTEGQTVYLRGNNPSGFSAYKYKTDYSYVYSTIKILGKCTLGGTVQSLLFKDDMSGSSSVTHIPKVGCFTYLFANNKSILNVPENFLPATTLKDYCYSGMFYNCTSLTTSPNLPAETLTKYCYEDMFSGCSSLQSAPTLKSTAITNGVYRGMFSGCTSLTTAPALPATTLANYCYESMFEGCSNLTTLTSVTPEGTDYLPATTLANSCYKSMFSDCSLLSFAPDLPSETVTNYCYTSMFKNCKLINTAPKLPATTLYASCYESMFEGCSSLTTLTPVTEGDTNYLPAMKAAQSCYKSMFSGCSSLAITPNIPITELASHCYNSMFKGCAITVAPKLPVEELEIQCYSSMFEDCTKLTTLTPVTEGKNDCLPATTLTTYCYYSMFKNCSSLSTAPELPASTVVASCYASMFEGCSSLTKSPEIAISNCATNCCNSMFKNCKQMGLNNITLSSTTLAENCYQYMFYGCEKITETPTLPATTLAKCCYQYMFANCVSLTTAPALPATIFYNSSSSIYASYCYSHMYENCTKLTTLTIASDNTTYLPATTIYQYCYEYMFYGCNSLENVTMNIPTTLYKFCFSFMFYNCTNLSTINNQAVNNSSIYKNLEIWTSSRTFQEGWCLGMLGGDIDENNASLAPYKLTQVFTMPSTSSSTYSVKSYCFSGLNSYNKNLTTFSASSCLGFSLAEGIYSHMFEGCENLTTAIIPSKTNLKSSCYEYMYKGCKKITKTCTFYATSLSSSCYKGMFEDCTSLTTINDLKATTLAEYCYSSMFSGCTSLATTPTLSVTTLAKYCYCRMFEGCTSLASAPSLPALTATAYCYYRMFQGCTSLTVPPTLPATTLDNWCYCGMFEGCTSLTKAPALPTSITYPEGCCQSMFSGCTNLKTLTGASSTTYYLYGTQENSCFLSMFKDCIKLKINYTGKGSKVVIFGSNVNNCFNMFYGTGGDITWEIDYNITYYYES